MTVNLVTIRDVHVSLGDNAVLRGVNAGLERGRVTALIGPNGSGKTTLLRAILKEIPYTGRIDFHCGHDHRQPMPQHVGYVPQRLQIDARWPLTVRDLLGMALQKRPLFLGVSRRSSHVMEQILARVWAPVSLLDRPVDKLSGGELQRVLLALALQPEPELLLLDEPAAGIDFKHEEKFYELLARLNAETGVTILLISHELSMVSRHVHHVLCLNEGRIQCEGTPQEMLTGEALAKVFGTEKGIFTHHH